MFGPSLPRNMRALMVEPEKTLVVQDQLIPVIVDDEVLVKTAAIAIGPPDLLTLEFPPMQGRILGRDWAGTIIQVGKNVTARRVDERVAGVYTCAQALYHTGRLELAEPDADTVAEKDEWVFVYGGSSSCGQYAMQLAHASGYKVATVASPRHFALVRALGAAAVCDHRDPDTAVLHTKAATGDGVRRALDTIALPATQEVAQRVLGTAGGRVVTLLWANEERAREDVDVGFTLVMTGLGRAFDMRGTHFPVSAEDTAQMVASVAKIPDLVETGRLRPNPDKLWEGGLEAIPEGLTYLAEGRVSEEKIVFRV
ncbi:GroES-like protein [Trametes elegans]|nr:GroES-like protein [Trametes elegans]